MEYASRALIAPPESAPIILTGRPLLRPLTVWGPFDDREASVGATVVPDFRTLPVST